ncbi:MAG: DUF1127 domain-containing protein [Pseudomonadota bacterium]
MAYNFENETHNPSALKHFLAHSVQVVSLAVAYVRQAYRHLENRRGVEEMLQLDDALLRDIGLERADIRWASRLPLKCSAGEELARATGRRQYRKR